MKFINLFKDLYKGICIFKRKRKTIKIGKIKTPFLEIENVEVKSYDII
jgi:hypothetical protein